MLMMVWKRIFLGNMKPLIDADILAYECAFGAETGWEGESPPNFDVARELLENKLANICALVNATQPPKLFLTGKGNFREEIATLRKYKGKRSQEKPFHYNNLRAYIIGVLNAFVVDGMEADDALNIIQRTALDRGYQTIICSRDKDLRIADGWLYSWEVGNQPSFGPDYHDGGYGWISLSSDNKKLTGRGLKYFLAQCLMGDSADNIGGLPKYGPVLTYKTLGETNTYDHGLARVYSCYEEHYGDDTSKILLENGRLLWLTHSLDDQGKPILWEHFYE